MSWCIADPHEERKEDVVIILAIEPLPYLSLVCHTVDNHVAYNNEKRDLLASVPLAGNATVHPWEWWDLLLYNPLYWSVVIRRGGGK
jgi:hypothetical protein